MSAKNPLCIHAYCVHCGETAAEFLARYPERPAREHPAWLPWLNAHPGHHFYGLMIAHPVGCDRSCLADAPVQTA